MSGIADSCGFFQMDTAYEPALIETRQVFGISMEQRRNDAKISAATFSNIVSKNKVVSLLSSISLHIYPV